MTHEPTHLDLFSGIGGFALAAGWAGFRTVAFSEIDPYASAVLRKHWPDAPNLGDIRRSSTWPDIGNVSLITGGFPCQPHSLAGKRRGSSDHRHLWPAMRDVIERYEPAWVCAENVPGIIGVELDRVLSDLEGLGYRVQPLAVPACAVDAPHRRDRVWIVGWNANSMRCSGDGWREREIQDQDANPNGICEAVANACGAGLEGWQEQSAREECQATKRGGPAVPDTGCLHGPAGRGAAPGQEAQRGPQGQSGGCLWRSEAESGVCRVSDGIPNRSHRLKSLGNAIVPQVAYQILKAIREQIV